MMWLVAIVALVLFLAIVAFAWFKPRNLVYGETSHRAERKMEYGTETQTFDREHIGALPATENVVEKFLAKDAEKS